MVVKCFGTVHGLRLSVKELSTLRLEEHRDWRKACKERTVQQETIERKERKEDLI
jgi:hypothetical protein